MSGQDQTDWKEDAKLAKQAVKQTAQMPFYESEPPIFFIKEAN